MNSIKVLAGQTCIDIAVQALGDASRSMEVALMNDMGLTDDLVPGSMELVPDYDPAKRYLVQLFSYPSNTPASSDKDGSIFQAGRGIGYWRIKNDFIVQ